MAAARSPRGALSCYNCAIMLRSNTSQHKASHEPVYRHVLMQAWHLAWSEWRLWPFAFFASFLLTAGTYDAIGNIYFKIVRQADILGGNSPFAGMSWDSFGGVFGALTALQWTLGLSIVMLGFLAASCIAQGALVYSIGASRLGDKVDFRKALGIGARAFWPIAALNVMALAIFALVRFVVAAFMDYALTADTLAAGLLFVASFVMFVGLAFVITIIQIFALNAMILQGASVADGILRGYLQFKRHWVVSIETAVILAAIAILLNAALTYLVFVAGMPFMLLMVTAVVVKSPIMYFGAIVLGVVAMLAVFALATAILAQLQYAAWTFLYRKLGEGGVVPKLHRLVRSFIGRYSVPQS